MTDLYGNIPISGGSKKKDPPSGGKRIKDAPPPPSPQKNKDHSQGRGKYFIIPGVLVCLLITYYGLTTLFVPLYLEKKFPVLFQEKTGLSLNLGSVNFNPLKSALIIEDVIISTLSLNSAKNDLLNIDTIYIDLDLAELIKRRLAAESLLIKGALLTIAKYDDTTYNISRFLPQGSSPSSAFINLNTVPFAYSLNNIVVSESRILFEDTSTNTTHRIENIQLSLPTLGNFSYAVDNYIQPRFSAIINGSPVALTSDAPYSAAGADDSSKLSLSLQSINLPLYASYIPAQLPVTVKQGSADIDIEIAFKAEQDEDFRLNLDFQAQIENGLFESNDQAITLETPALRLEGTIMPLVRQIKMRNVLFRDPVVVVKDSISATTLTNLFQQNASPEKEKDDFLQSAAFDVSLLIADNGKCIIQSEKGERVFHPVQLSIKNFANAKSLLENPGSGEKQSFRLSGESKDNNTTFSWQGGFNKTTPTGNLEITHLPADDFLAVLAPDTEIKTKGTADIHGKLSVKRSQESPLAVIIDQGSAQLSSLSLEQNGSSILQSSELKISPFQLTENTINLGNIFIEDATVHVDQENPPILADMLNKKIKSIQGIDFKGNISVGERKDKSSLNMENVHLQINDLEKPKKENDNFAFSAAVNKNGSINAKGKISILPVDGIVEIAARNIPASILPATVNYSNYSLAPMTMINTTGSYNLSSESFDGTAELSMGEFIHSNKEKTFTFSKAVFGKVSIDPKKETFNGGNVLFKDFTINNKSYNLHAGGLSVSSFALQGKTAKIDSLEFAKTAITCKKDLSQLFSAVHKATEGDLNISSMRMNGSVAIADDNQQTAPLIDEFDLIVKTPENDAPGKHDIDLKAHFVDKGTLSANGVMQMQPLQLQIDMTLDQVNSKILRHFPANLRNYHLAATMSGNATFTYPEKIINGDIQFNQGYFADKSDKPLISWQKADLQNFKLGESPFTLEADRLFFNSPQITFTRDNTPILSKIRQNVIDYLEDIDTQEKSTAVPKIMLQRVGVSDGVIDYHTSSLSPPWQVKLTSVEGYINNFHTHESDETISYSLQGKIADADFSLDGSISSSLDGLENETSFELTSFPLTLLEKQFNSLFDVTFTESILDISFKKLNSADEYFADLTLTSLDINDYNSTTALALALISESSDKLSLTIPLKNTSQSLFTQVNNYFRRLIVKCSISPYLLLDWPYDSLQNRNSVSFAPGKTELSLESRDTLLDYSTLLEKHPLLELQFDATVQRSADTKALREILAAAERKRVDQENEKLLLEWQQRQINTDVSATPNDDIAVTEISEENLAKFTPGSPKEITITDTMLKQLGIDRAEQIRKYILDQSSISEANIAVDVDVAIIDTLDLPEVHIGLGHIGQK